MGSLPDHRKKILFLIESLAGGGAEKVLVTLLKYLDNNRFDITLCCVSDLGTHREEIPPAVQFCHILPTRTSLWYKLSYKLIYHLLPAKYIYLFFIPKGNDLEVAFTEGFVTKLLAASSNRKAKKIAWVHTDLIANPWPLEKRIFKSLSEEGLSYRKYDEVAAVSDCVRKAFETLFGRDIPITTIPNPIDAKDIRKRATDPVPIGPKKVFRMVTVGRLVPQKAFDRLLRVAYMLKREGFLFELWLLGEGPCWQQLKGIIEGEKLLDNVRLWGYQSNPYPFLSSADLFVCSSVAEGLSTAATEALILGIPIVTTDCSGMTELFGGKACGIITRQDELSLFQGVRALLADPKRLACCKREAIERGQSIAEEDRIKTIESYLSS